MVEGLARRSLRMEAKAQRVLPVPVGAQTRTFWPFAMAGMARRWGSDMAGNLAAHQVRRGGENWARMADSSVRGCNQWMVKRRSVARWRHYSEWRGILMEGMRC